MNSISEFESKAREELPLMAFDYVFGGSGEERTLGENLRAFRRIKLVNDTMVDVSGRDGSTTILGHHLKFPCIVAPMAYHKLMHDEGEIGTAP